jgi:hypothetical protein
MERKNLLPIVACRLALLRECSFEVALSCLNVVIAYILKTKRHGSLTLVFLNPLRSIKRHSRTIARISN